LLNLRSEDAGWERIPAVDAYPGRFSQGAIRRHNGSSKKTVE